MARIRGDREQQSRRWLPKALIGIGVFALVMMGLSTVMLSQWSELRTASPVDADAAFESAIAAAGAGRPYVSITEDGTVEVRRELEGVEPAALTGLCVLAWDPAQNRLLEVAFPWWFVRMKLSNAFNLGTLTSAMAHDWGNLNLSVTEEDLERLGPGVVLDHRTEDGARILLWTE